MTDVCVFSTTFVAKQHLPCVAHILNLIVQSTIKSFVIPYATLLMEEECNKQLTTSNYVNDMDVEEDFDVGTSISTPMHMLYVTLDV